MDTGNYSAAGNNMKLVHWPLMGGLLHLVHRGGAAARPGLSLLHQNPTYQRPVFTVLIALLLYNNPLLCPLKR